ncbi:MAG: type II toxin-antitoxin system VapC family toxin [Chloroflexota bacterium]
MTSESTTNERSSSDIIVIDASLVFRLVVHHPTQPIVQEHFQAWIDQGHDLITPSLWFYEITSAITKAIHFKHLTQPEADSALQQAFDLDIEVIQPSETLAINAAAWTTKLQRANAYDSFYLALADYYNAPLWTADGKLVRAVNQAWVRLGTE